MTALMLTIGKGRTDVMELLIKHNANVNTRAKVRVHMNDIV